MNKNIDSHNELPSMAKLIKSTIIAIFLAAVILITVVLPAEYGIDPTGMGEMIGLLKMGEIKVSLAEEANAEKEELQVASTQETTTDKIISLPESVESKTELTVNKDEMKIILKPNEGKEIKLAMLKGEQVNFIWFTDGGKANFDAHADSKALKISYHNYEKGSMERNEGIMEAAFDGKHGWFWRNRTSKNMIVTLQVDGSYSDIKIME